MILCDTIVTMKKEIDVEKIIKRVQTEADKKNERRFGIMMEEMDDKFKIVQDQFKGVNEKLDLHTEEIKEIRMDIMEVKRDVKDVKFWVTNQLQNKVGKKDFVDMDSRVRRLEKTK